MPLKSLPLKSFSTYLCFSLLRFHKNKSYNSFASVFQIPFSPLFYYCYLFVPKIHERKGWPTARPCIHRQGAFSGQLPAKGAGPRGDLSHSAQTSHFILFLKGIFLKLLALYVWSHWVFVAACRLSLSCGGQLDWTCVPWVGSGFLATGPPGKPPRSPLSQPDSAALGPWLTRLGLKTQPEPTSCLPSWLQQPRTQQGHSSLEPRDLQKETSSLSGRSHALCLLLGWEGRRGGGLARWKLSAESCLPWFLNGTSGLSWPCFW